MENKNAMQENRRLARQKAIDNCPIALDVLQTGMICCLLDDNLTFRWGNSSFFSSIGYSMERFCGCFHDLRQYYTESSDDFAAIRQELTQAVKCGNSKIEMSVRLPLREGGFNWAHLYGTVKEDCEAGGSVLLAELTDITTIAAEKEEMSRLYEQKLGYFHWMMDTYVGNIYVCDMDTYELLYVNQTSCDVLGIPASKVVGKKCYEVIQGRTSPCHSVPTINCAKRNFMSGNLTIRIWDGPL